ncbi:hypothetical protein L211DRAFT_833531 [Terfezia boudieri ATCC MYA-4762]|uniref:Large ribosomal subunit protein bL32m n=1 Tax=Terfezia boudieri ATCC MYA-4762 TaxID=1051890 RepID=A0A3N4M6F3_9PEZI|nr:hypothetical protein L211DRAFT_833531 [Terfezia boudieri ATCC MYA-4762]
MAAALLPSARQGIFSTLRSALAVPAFVVPAITLNIPNILPGIWESILRAVPKKKPTYSKRRMRQLAGKALPTLINLNNCPGCGRVKRAHTLCEHCVNAIRSLWRKGNEEIMDSTI